MSKIILLKLLIIY